MRTPLVAQDFPRQSYGLTIWLRILTLLLIHPARLGTQTLRSHRYKTKSGYFLTIPAFHSTLCGGPPSPALLSTVSITPPKPMGFRAYHTHTTAFIKSLSGAIKYGNGRQGNLRSIFWKTLSIYLMYWVASCVTSKTHQCCALTQTSYDTVLWTDGQI